MRRLWIVVSVLGCAPRAPAVVAHAPPTAPPVAPAAPAVRGDPLLPGAPTQLANGVALYAASSWSWRREPAHIQLVIRAGSLAEADDQRGVARWVAELAAARVGVPATVTAGYERTTIDIPLGEDLAHGLARAAELISVPLDDAAIEADRARVVRRAAHADPPEVAIASTSLAAHPPDGDPRALGAVAAERVRAFRATWWTPSRLAVVVTTDTIVDVEPLVRETFGTLPVGADAPEPVVPAAGGARGPDVGPATERRSYLVLAYLAARRPLVHESDLRARVRTEVFVTAVRARLAAELDGWRPLLDTDVTVSPLSPRIDVVRLGFTSPGSLAWVREAVLPVIASIARDGLSRDELAAAIDDRRRRFEDELQPRRIQQGSIGTAVVRTPTVELAELGDHDIRREELARRSLALLPAPDDPVFARLAAELALRRAAIRAEQVRGDPSELSREAIDATPPRARGPATLALAPAPGRVTAETAAAGIVTWQLSNGATVRFEPGPLEVVATSPGGALEEPAARLFAALAVPDVARVLQVATLDASARERWAAGRFELALEIEPHHHGLRARLRDPAALPDLLALIHATFTAPVRDDALIAGALAAHAAERVKETELVPAPALPPRLALELGIDLPPPRAIRGDDVWASLRARFDHAAGFTFTLRGIDPAAARAAVERYLASIPAGTPDRAGPAVQPAGRIVVPRELAGCGIELHWTGIADRTTGPLDDTDIVAAALDAAPDLDGDASWIGSSPEVFHVRAETTWRCREHGTTEAAIRQLVARYARGAFDDETLGDVRSALAKRLELAEDDPRIASLDRARLASAMKRLLPGVRIVVIR